MNSKLARGLINPEDLVFECPGCRMMHRIPEGPGPGPQWTWNQSMDRPTFNPSILVQWSSMSAQGRETMNRFKEEHGRYPDDGEFPYDTKNVCHSFIKDGKIQFLGDCTHALANQTVDLPDWEQDPPGFTPGLHGADTQF